MKRRWMYVCLLILGGCAVGPNYKEPQNTVDSEWTSEEIGVSTKDPNLTWWEVFDDPLLVKYIQMAKESNNDVLSAEANVLYARALRMVQAAPLFPQINANINGAKFYFSKNGPLFSNKSLEKEAAVAPVSPVIPQILPLYNLLFDASWEIDIFGKTRRSIEAAEANIGSAIEEANDILITTLAEIAKNYIEIRSNQKLAMLIEENIALLEKNKEITLANYERGLYNKLNLETIDASLANARAQLPSVIAQVYQSIYAIAALTGNPPETLLPELLPIGPMPKLPWEVAVGLRSDLLRRRPDVRQAERQLAAATANIGVAVASFYPSFNLLALGGLDSIKLTNLFKIQSRIWGFGGDINIPIFKGGQLVGNLHANRALTAAAAYNYQQTVLGALQEAETNLKKYIEDQRTEEQYLVAVQKNCSLVNLTDERYSKGLVNLMDLLQAKEQLVAAEENLLTSDTTALLDLISLYKALGGGWESETKKPEVLVTENPPEGYTP
jgi:multidrug efflux system outer membrane protein